MILEIIIILIKECVFKNIQNILYKSLPVSHDEHTTRVFSTLTFKYLK